MTVSLKKKKTFKNSFQIFHISGVKFGTVMYGAAEALNLQILAALSFLHHNPK